MSRVKKATSIPTAVRKIVRERDGGCIFCEHLGFERTGMATEIMHYISRAQGGRGIPENLAVGCIYHHRLMDQGIARERQMMRALFRHYLREKYPDWNEDSLRVRNRWEADK